MARKRSSEAPVFEIDGKPVSKSTYYRAKKNGKVEVAAKPKRGRPPGPRRAAVRPPSDTQRQQIATKFATDRKRDDVELVVKSQVDQVLLSEFLWTMRNATAEHDVFTFSARTARAIANFIESGA